MTRGIWTKWIVGGIVLLIIVAGACYLWYRHDTAAGRKAAAQTEKQLQEWKANKAQKPTITAETEETQTPAESTTPTAEKPTTDTTAVTKNTEPIQVQSDVPAQTAETTDVPVSPHGFGPYPEVPADYPGDYGRPEVDWDLRFTPSGELLTRVLVKLWTEGERNFRGGSTHNGKVYPHYYDTVYVRVEKTEAGRIIHRKSGPFVDFSSEDLDNPPAHLRILDLETSGIDPYRYLNLPK